MATWAEYLRSQGATAEEVTLLDTPAARRAYDKQVADASAALEAERANSKQAMTDYRSTVQDWYDTKVIPEQDGFKAAAETARANELRARSIITERAKTDEGLRQVAKNMGWDLENDKPPAAPPANTPPANGFTKDEVVGLMRDEANAMLMIQDIAAEHGSLFPGQRLNFTALGEEARAKKMRLDRYWEDKYKVPEARAKVESDRRAAEEAAIRKDEREKAQAEFANRYGNPALRPPMPSDNPFAKINRPAADAKQPWERTGSEVDRVTDAAKRVTEKLRGQGLTVN